MGVFGAGRGVIGWTCFLAWAPIAVAAQLSLPVQSAGAGSSFLIPAVFAPGPDPVSDVQFDLQYDSSAMSLIVTAGDAARTSGKSIYYNDLSPNERRFVITGLNQNSIPEGTLINLFVIVNPNASSGVHALTFTNLSSSGPDGESMPAVGGISGSVTVDGPAGSRLQASGILNAASLNSGPVSPGEIVTLIGSGIGPAGPTAPPASAATSTMLGGTSVLFDGTAAPLLYAAPNQINAIVPFGVSGQDTTQLLIMNGGQVIAGFPVDVSAAVPAIFTLAASGVGAGAILNQDQSLNSQLNPADRGSVVAIFATGFGQTDPPSVDGQIAADASSHAALSVVVRISGVDSEVLYAGPAPGLVAGIFQVNCRVPATVGPGDEIPVQVIVGGAFGPVGVMLAIR